MRYFLSVLLLPVLAPLAMAQGNDAEKLFRDMEKKIQSANAVQLAVNIELRAIKGREEESQLKDKVRKANGFLLFTKDNKTRLKISGEYISVELVSNGKQLKLAGEEESIEKVKAMPTPGHLHTLLSALTSRGGVTIGSMIIGFAPGPQFERVFLKDEFKGFDPDQFRMSVSDFKAVAPEKIDGRDTKVIQYRFGEPGDNSEEPITLWIDAKTMLPLKRVISLKFENLHITEYYTDFKLDPKLDANAFDLVSAPANEAEKLFRAVEEKVKSAKAVQFTFDIEMKEKDKQAKSRGSLLFTNANQARLKMTVPEDAKEVTVEMISDGKRMKMAESPDTLAKADDAATPANLHSMLSSFVCGPGLLLTFDRLNPGPAPPMFRLVNFNTGPTEKLGGRDAKVVTYNVTLLGGTAEVTLWIDAEKMLPLKRVIVADGKGDTVRVTELCSVSLDPKVQADAFVLPK